MPALIQPGAEVRPYAAGDGTTQIPCPACTHYIPNVAHDALTIGEQRPTAAFIRCACPQGQGTNITGRRVTCRCHAVFRLHPQGMQRYVVAEGWQEESKPGWPNEELNALAAKYRIDEWLPRGDPPYMCPVHDVPFLFRQSEGVCPQCQQRVESTGPEWLSTDDERFIKAYERVWSGMASVLTRLAHENQRAEAAPPSPPVALVKRRRRK